jgi:hypothetical protein
MTDGDDTEEDVFMSESPSDKKDGDGDTNCEYYAVERSDTGTLPIRMSFSPNHHTLTVPKGIYTPPIEGRTVDSGIWPIAPESVTSQSTLTPHVLQLVTARGRPPAITIERTSSARLRSAPYLIPLPRSAERPPPTGGMTASFSSGGRMSRPFTPRVYAGDNDLGDHKGGEDGEMTHHLDVELAPLRIHTLDQSPLPPISALPIYHTAMPTLDRRVSESTAMDILAHAAATSPRLDTLPDLIDPLLEGPDISSSMFASLIMPLSSVSALDDGPLNRILNSDIPLPVPILSSTKRRL